MNWKLPNQLTVGRIVLSAAFFVLLGLYEQGAPAGRRLLVAALVLYIIAGITDILDGWIARKWNLTSAFGRIADPFVDKVLVVGAFAMLAGSNYAFDERFVCEFERNLPGWLTGGMSSGVQAWMVVVILGREFVVSAIRGYSESQGQKFPATSAGKIKMFIQSVAICMVLFQLAIYSPPAVGKTLAWTIVVRIAVVWLAVIITVVSGLAYIGKARRLLRSDGKD